MSGYIGTQPVPQATQTRDAFTATAGQTSFATGGYTPQFLDVYLNGVHLQNGTDYTAANGSDVVLTTGAALDDVLEVVAYTTFEVLDQTFTGTTTVDVLDVTGTVVMDGGSTSADFTFGDNDKAIFGDGSDLQIYHSGAQSVIADVGTGQLTLSTNGTDIRLADSSGNRMLIAKPSAAVELYHNGSPKLATTNAGVDVTGTITSDGLTVDNAQIGPANTTWAYQGMSFVQGKDSSVANTTSYIDFKNNLSTPDAHVFADHLTDGSSALIFGTTPAGSRSTDRRVERMRINGAGVITTPYQPLCSVNNGAGWLNMAAYTTYGVGSSFYTQRGGFYAGSSLGGYPVTHVPATGLYRITLQAYVADNQPGRLNLRVNQSSGLCFLQIPSIPTHTAFTEVIVSLNAGDYLDYITDATMSLYHANQHTFLTLEYLG